MSILLSDDVKSRTPQNKTQSGLDSVGKIVDKDDFVVEGIRKVLSPNAKVRLMNKAGEGVVEMTEKEKAAHGGQQQGVEDKNKNAQNSGKIPPGEVDEYDENIDDKANDNNPKKDQLQPPKNAEQDRKVEHIYQPYPLPPTSDKQSKSNKLATRSS